MSAKRKNPMEIEIVTESDTYTTKVPTGDLGWRHFELIMELENERASALEEIRVQKNPETGEEEDVVVRIPQPTEHKIEMLVMKKWVAEVLPGILISHTIEQIPWWDLPRIFQKVVDTYNIDTKNFRPVQE